MGNNPFLQKMVIIAVSLVLIAIMALRLLGFMP